MRSLGLDVGGRKTGVAISDTKGVLAVPLTVIARKDQKGALSEIVKLVQRYQVECVVVGLPYSLDGHLTEEAEKIKAFTEKLQSALAASRDSEPSPSHPAGVSIQMWDERLSSVAAEELMIEAGTKKAKREQHRDAIAAAIILQGFLDGRCSEDSFCHSEGEERPKNPACGKLGEESK
jgi:putative Holliday junction resolvase